MFELDKCGGRKFVLCMTIATTNILLMAFGLIPASVYQAIILGTAGVYMTANVSQKVFVKEPNV